MTQEEFDFDAPLTGKVLKQYLKFHAANPHILPLLVEMARKASRNGTRQCSIAMLFEVCRWRMNVETERTDEFKMSNSLRAPYARVIMDENPDLAGIFVLRPSEVDGQL